jgi:hypothetical protein
MTPIQIGSTGCLINLVLYAWKRDHVNLGCAIICGSMALAFYFL